MRFVRDVQKPCRRASLITGALIGEPGGVCLPGLLGVKEKHIWVPQLDPEAINI